MFCVKGQLKISDDRFGYFVLIWSQKTRNPKADCKDLFAQLANAKLEQVKSLDISFLRGHLLIDAIE